MINLQGVIVSLAAVFHVVLLSLVTGSVKLRFFCMLVNMFMCAFTCIYVDGGQRLISDAFLACSPLYFFETESLIKT